MTFALILSLLNNNIGCWCKMLSSRKRQCFYSVPTFLNIVLHIFSNFGFRQILKNYLCYSQSKIADASYLSYDIIIVVESCILKDF